MQNANEPLAFGDMAPEEFARAEESARYALLRRLAPAIRHHMVGEFQPMGMISAMMERRLQADIPNIPNVRENCATLGSLSRTAANSCMNLMTWIAPRGETAQKLDAGVLECLGLLSTEFRFKGFVVVNETSGVDTEVPITALRSVFTAALIALTDLSHPPAELVIRASALTEGVELTVELRPTGGSSEHTRMAEYRLLAWLDVDVLAHAESVTFARDSNGLQLNFPAVRAV